MVNEVPRGSPLGKDHPTKMDEFLEKFLPAFGPPPSFCRFFEKVQQKCACSLRRYCYVLYDPISHEMHVVQQLKMVKGFKTYPENPPLHYVLKVK